MIPEFETKKELFDFLVKNEKTLIAQKRAVIKQADSLCIEPSLVFKKLYQTNKELGEDIPDILPDKLTVKAIINTTNILDSHLDVHLPGIWNKSLQENKFILHLQEHECEFEKIISDGKDLNAYVMTFNWTELGINYSGTTEALVFESTINKDRNEYMLDQYRRGYVKNHSVGMRYIKIIMCINSEEYGAQYEAWQKYYPEIVNKDKADEFGYFWAVKEAQVIEGSAVPIGSNWATPTLSVKEPVNSAQKDKEPLFDAQKANELLYNFKIFS